MQETNICHSSISIYHKNSKNRERHKLTQHNKGYVWKVHSQHHNLWGKTKSFSSKVQYKAILTLAISITVSEVLMSNQTRKKKAFKSEK